MRSVKLVVSTTSVSPSKCPRALPMYCLIAGPTCGAAVERNHARVVHHLVADHDRVGGLHDAEAVAVEHGKHAADAARDAAVVEREILEAVERPGAEGADAEGGLLLGEAGLRQPREAAVGRFDDERGVAEGADPEFVPQERFLVHGAVARRLVAAGPTGELLGRERFAAALRRRARGGNAAHVVAGPDAFQVRVAPGQARSFPARILHLGRGRLGGNRAQFRGRLGGRREAAATQAAAATATALRRRGCGPGWGGRGRLRTDERDRSAHTHGRHEDRSQNAVPHRSFHQGILP